MTNVSSCTLALAQQRAAREAAVAPIREAVLAKLHTSAPKRTRRPKKARTP